MTDSQKDAQSIPLINGKPHWELAAPSVAYPLQFQASGKFFEVYVHLKTYAGDLLISILNSTPGSYRRNASNVETFNGDDSKFARLTDECLVKLEGTTSDDPTAHRKWLDQNPRQKIRIARDLLGGVDIDTDMPNEVPGEDAARLELLPLALECNETHTNCVQELYDTGRKLKTKVRMSHTLRSDTEQDWRRWARTGTETFSKATKEWKSSVNWWNRAELYDAMAMSITGMCINGKPCTVENKSEWLPLVPTWHKLLVITSVFDETRVKNG